MPDKPTKPDFSDGIYSQMGCVLGVLGVLAGFALAIAATLFVPHPGDMDGGSLLTVGLGALAVTIWVTMAAMELMKRTPAVWRHADDILFVIYFALPAGIVTTVLLTALGRSLIWLLGLAVIALVLALAWVGVGEDLVRGFLGKLVGPRAPREEWRPESQMAPTPHRLVLVVGDLRLRAEQFSTEDRQSDNEDGYDFGYALTGPGGEEYGRSLGYIPETWAEAGVVVTRVDGVMETDPKGPRRTDFIPGRPVALLAEPPHRWARNIVGVWNSERTVRLGYLLTEDADALAGKVESYRAYVLREAGFVTRKAGYVTKHRRLAIVLVLGPGLTIEVPVS